MESTNIMNKCAKCGKTADHLPIYDCGLEFCSLVCQKLYRYKPFMTDTTWEEDTVIDLIDIDKRTDLILETPDGFYSMVSHYKAIMVLYRGLCKPKQVGSYHSLDEAKQDWEKYKKKHNFKSWADINKHLLKQPKEK